MRALLERSILPVAAALFVWWSFAPPAVFAHSALRFVLLLAVGIVLVVAGALWLLGRSNSARKVAFVPLDDDDPAALRLQERAMALLDAGFEAGPPRYVRPEPGTPMNALPLVHQAGSTWALLLEAARRRAGPEHPRHNEVLELLTVFANGLRVSTVDNRVAAAAPRPSSAIVQVQHGVDAETLWQTHDRTLRALERAGLRAEPADPGAFEGLLRATVEESFEVLRARPLSTPALTVWHLLFAANPCERPLLSQPAVLRLLRSRGAVVQRQEWSGPRGVPAGLGDDWRPAAPSRRGLLKLTAAALVAAGLATWTSRDMVGTLDWQHIDATIQSAEITSESYQSSEHGTVTEYRLSCRYTYAIDGLRYPGDHCTASESLMDDRDDAYAMRDRLREYAEAGASWPAWVDPADPYGAVLFRPLPLSGLVLAVLAATLWLCLGLKLLGAAIWFLHMRRLS